MNNNEILLILDCDGVLIDSEIISSRIEVEELHRIGCPITLDDYLDVALGRTEEEQIWKAIADQFEVSLPPEFAFETRRRVLTAFESELQAIPGVHEALLKIPCRKCVASGSRMDRLQRNLKLVGLDMHFNGNVFSASQVARGKPFPDLFLHSAGQMGFNPDSCLVVEDSIPGVRGATAAGMTVVGFTGASHCHSDLGPRLTGAGAQAVFRNIQELPELCRDFHRSRRVRALTPG